jgi:hypothetical protein
MKTKSSLRLPFFYLRVLICFALFRTLAICAYASTITVTTTNDSGPGSLRQALVDANDGDTITFAVTGTIGLTSGELAIDKNVTITGPGPDTLAVSGSFLTFRVLHVTPGRTVNIEGLTVTLGFPQFDVGGGILNDHAILTLTNCWVATNGAYYGGGGIYNDGGNGSATLTIIDSSVTGNGVGGSGADGGGIYNNGAAILTIINSTISGNSAIGEFELSGGGGGIAGDGTIINSTIAGNHAALEGGGILGGGTITSCTISGNSAGGGDNYRPGIGGGIFGGGMITNCTISGNSVYGNDFKGPGAGGGIYAAGDLTISNSTLSNNSVAYGDGGNILNYGSVDLGNTVLNGGQPENIFSRSGTVTSHGYNISSDNGGGYLTGPGDQINADPLLGPLQDNGGPTFTHELLAGSSAIDAGDPNFTPPPWYDQRGPDFYRLRNDRIDIGSFEVQEGPAVTPTPSPTPTATATPTVTPTPRPIPTPRSRPTPRIRPTPG